MRSNYYVEAGEALPYIKEHGRCAVSGQPFTAGYPISAMLLPLSAEWPLPVWGDYPMGKEAKSVAFVLRAAIPAGGIPLSRIIEATRCDGHSISFHPVTFLNEQAHETAILQEV